MTPGDAATTVDHTYPVRNIARASFDRGWGGLTLPVAVGVALLGGCGPRAPTLPVSGAGAGPVVALAAGDRHTCALRASGAVTCWGVDGSGVLTGARGDHRRVWGDQIVTFDGPVAVPALDDAVAVSAGADFTCALRRTGAVACWGENAHGELGVPSTPHPLPPRDVPGLGDVVQVAAGGHHACAARRDGSVWCWGAHRSSADAHASVALPPTPIPSIANAIGVASGGSRSCAVTQDGGVVCWRDIAGAAAPEPVEGLAGVRAITLGARHACALDERGAVWCWGANDEAQIDWDTRGQESARPILERSFPAARSVVAGGAHTCVVAEGGRAVCFGANQWDQCGRFPDGRRVAPSPPRGLDDVRLVAAGANHTCALLGDGVVACLGLNFVRAPARVLGP